MGQKTDVTMSEKTKIAILADFGDYLDRLADYEEEERTYEDGKWSVKLEQDRDEEGKALVFLTIFQEK